MQGIANNPCTNVQDQIQLTINEAALANAGPNATICEGSTYSLSSATASGYANLVWITSGSGLFSNSTIQNPIYTPSLADIASGSVTLTLTSNAFSACTNAVSSMILTITRQVVVNAGSNGQVCQNTSYTVSGATAQYFNSINWTHNGAGLLSNINTLAPTYTPGAGESGTITLILNGIANIPCADASDNMQLTIHPLPLANAGPDGATCEGFNFTVSGSSATNYNNISWTRSGTGNLLNATTLSPTYVPGPGETGVVTLTMTVTGTNSCSAESSVDAMVLNITPLPFVTAGSDATICAANTYNVSGTQQFCGITNWTSSGDGTFTNPGSLVSTYVPGPSDIAAGTVTLTLTGAGVNSCAAVNSVDQLVLTIDPMPAINAGPDASYCITGPVQLTGTSAAFYSSIQWFTSGDGILTNPLTIAPTYMPGNIDYNNGTVTLTLWAQGRLSCASQTVTDDVIWAVAPYPIVLAGPDDYICSNVTQFQLNGLGNNYNGANIQWSFAGGDGFLSNANIMNPVYFAGPVDLSTQNRSIIFTLTLQGNGSCSGVFVNDQIELKIDPTPESNAGPDDEICDQRPYQVNATGQYQSSMTWTTSGDGSFSNTNIFNPIYTPGPNDVGQTVVLTLQVQGCQSLTGGDFMWLTVHEDPSATISGTTSICEATATPVTIDLTGTPPWSVTYTNGVTPVTVNNIMTTPYVFNVTPPVTSSYWISASNDVNCTTPADSIHGLVSITVIPLPDPFTTTASNSGVFCEGTAGVTLGLSGSQVGMTYELLFNGLPEGTILPGTGSPLSFGIKNTPGQYSILGTNPVGNCQKMMNDTVTVIMNPIPVTDFTTNTVCNSDTTFFTISGNFIQNTSQWHWDFGDGTFATFNAPTNPYHIYPTYGTYLVTLSVEDTNNCNYSISHPVEVRPHPTAFFSYNTPNCLGDPSFFIDLSNNPVGQGYISQWVWSYGDGTPNDTIDFPNTSNTMHQYAGDGTYPVTCISPIAATARIFTAPLSLSPAVPLLILTSGATARMNRLTSPMPAMPMEAEPLPAGAGILEILHLDL
ncbi:MAG: PKD domain-containing protein [Bacteroidales bacterium]|nr:PKD domain-containing protein [Bacteroidales bacterium]